MAGESEARVTITLSQWRAKIASGEITPQNAASFKIVADPDTEPDIDISVAERLTTMELFNITSRQISATNGNAGIKLESVFDNPSSDVKIVGSGDVSVTSNANGDIVVATSSSSSAHVNDPNRLTTAKAENLYTIGTTTEGHVASATAVTVTDGLTLDNSKNLKHSNAVTAGTASGSATGPIANGGSIVIPSVTYDAQGHITAKGTTTVTLPTFAAGSGLEFGNDGVTINHSNSITAGTASGSATGPIANGGSIVIPSVTYDAQGHITAKGSSTVTLPTFAAGAGLAIDTDGLTFKHTNTVTAGTASGTATSTLANGSNFDIPSVTYDAQGHITAKGTTTITLPTFTGSDGVSVSGTSITNSGVRSISTGASNGTISVNTNGTAAEVSVYGLGSAAYKNTTSTYSATGTDPTTGAAVAEAIAEVTNLLGANNGIATLDSTGKIPSSQIPGSYDDVENYATQSAFPDTGEDGKIYVAKDTNTQFRWGGESYIPIGSYLALGETSSTAYRGDRGATAYSHATDTNRLTTAKNEGLYTVATTAEGHVASATAVTVTDGLTLDNSKNLKHSNSITAGTASGSATATLSNGGSFNIPTVTYDAQGHITAKGTTTITIPTLAVGTGMSLSGTTVSAKLKVTTALTADSSAATETANRIYSVVPDKSGNLSVVVPWTDHTYTIPTKVSDLDNDAGYTTNTGTVTQVKIGTTAYNPASGIISLPAYPTTLPASDVSDWAKAASKPSYSASEVGAATSDHTHTTTIAADSGTSALNMTANTKYKLTAGGNTFIFKTPADTTYSSKEAASGGTDVSLVTTGEKYAWNNKSNLTIGNTATTAAAGNHTHDYSSTYAAKSHTHTTNDVTALTGYTIASSAAAIAATDSLNTALGKLQKSLDGKGTSNLTIGTTGTTAAAGNHTHDYSNTYAAKSHTHGGADVTALTGYSKASSAAAIAATDSLLTALGKLEKTLDGKGTSNLTIGTTGTTAAAGNHTHSGYAASTHTHAGADVTALTGYSKASSAASIAATDSLLTALGKLEKTLDGKGTSNLTIGTTASTAAAGNHTHSGYAAKSHTHGGADVTALTGYSKASSAAAIAATDSLLTALGKLEKTLDGKGTSNLTIGTSSTTAAAGNHTHSGYAASSHDHHSTSYSTQALRHLASGTSAATTTNCPSGAWYGYHS